jgi:hypothetical protein
MWPPVVWHNEEPFWMKLLAPSSRKKYSVMTMDRLISELIFSPSRKKGLQKKENNNIKTSGQLCVKSLVAESFQTLVCVLKTTQFYVPEYCNFGYKIQYSKTHTDIQRLTKNALSCILLYLHNGSYMFRQNNAILREQLGSFLSYFNANMVEGKSEYNTIIQ